MCRIADLQVGEVLWGCLASIEAHSTPSLLYHGVFSGFPCTAQDEMYLTSQPCRDP